MKSNVKPAKLKKMLYQIIYGTVHFLITFYVSSTSHNFPSKTITLLWISVLMAYISLVWKIDLILFSSTRKTKIYLCNFAAKIMKKLLHLCRFFKGFESIFHTVVYMVNKIKNNWDSVKGDIFVWRDLLKSIAWKFSK